MHPYTYPPPMYQPSQYYVIPPPVPPLYTTGNNIMLSMQPQPSNMTGATTFSNSVVDSHGDPMYPNPSNVSPQHHPIDMVANGGGGDKNHHASRPVVALDGEVDDDDTACTLVPACRHNNWDNVRVKKGVVTLACRVCHVKWKTLSTIVKCPDFFNGWCFIGVDCPLLHVHRYKNKAKSPDPANYMADEEQDKNVSLVISALLNAHGGVDDGASPTSICQQLEHICDRLRRKLDDHRKHMQPPQRVAVIPAVPSPQGTKPQGPTLSQVQSATAAGTTATSTQQSQTPKPAATQQQTAIQQPSSTTTVTMTTGSSTTNPSQAPNPSSVLTEPPNLKINVKKAQAAKTSDASPTPPDPVGRGFEAAPSNVLPSPLMGDMHGIAPTPSWRIPRRSQFESPQSTPNQPPLAPGTSIFPPPPATPSPVMQTATKPSSKPPSPVIQTPTKLPSKPPSPVIQTPTKLPSKPPSPVIQTYQHQPYQQDLSVEKC